MRTFTRIVSLIALAATILPSVAFFMDRIDLAAAKGWMLAGTAAWFAATPFWMDSTQG